MDDEALVIDFNEKNLSIGLLNDALANLGLTQKVVFANLSREDVQFLRAAMDCYSNVGLQLENLTNKIEQMAQRMDSKEQPDEEFYKKVYKHQQYQQLQPPPGGGGYMLPSWTTSAGTTLGPATTTLGPFLPINP